MFALCVHAVVKTVSEMTLLLGLHDLKRAPAVALLAG